MTREQLLPPEVAARLPSLDELETRPAGAELVVQVKFFYPDFDWTWYGVAWDGDDIFYGLVEGFERELGYFLLSELLENRGTLGCTIERDLSFAPRPLSEVMSRGEHAAEAPDTGVASA